MDRGFVAQVADVVYGREAPLNAEQRTEGIKTIPGEFSNVKHVRGILSMGRYGAFQHLVICYGLDMGVTHSTHKFRLLDYYQLTKEQSRKQKGADVKLLPD